MDEEKEPDCQLCHAKLLNTINLYVYTSCSINHPVCALCHLKLHFLKKANICPFCKLNWEFLFFSRKRQTADLFEPTDGSYLQFDSEESAFLVKSFVSFYCKFCRKANSTSLDQLKTHTQKVHSRYFCLCCAKHLLCFPAEYVYFENKREKLLHLKTAHKKCFVCNVLFFDEAVLKTHVIDKHFYCVFCLSSNFSASYFFSRNFLKDHFKFNHFLCEQEGCKHQLDFVVFKKEKDYSNHMITAHGELLDEKTKASLQKTVTINDVLVAETRANIQRNWEEAQRTVQDFRNSSGSETLLKTNTNFMINHSANLKVSTPVNSKSIATVFSKTKPSLDLNLKLKLKIKEFAQKKTGFSDLFVLLKTLYRESGTESFLAFVLHKLETEQGFDNSLFLKKVLEENKSLFNVKHVRAEKDAMNLLKVFLNRSLAVLLLFFTGFNAEEVVAAESLLLNTFEKLKGKVTAELVKTTNNKGLKLLFATNAEKEKAINGSFSFSEKEKKVFRRLFFGKVTELKTLEILTDEELGDTFLLLVHCFLAAHWLKEKEENLFCKFFPGKHK